MSRPWERQHRGGRGWNVDYRADALRVSENAALAAKGQIKPWKELDPKVRRYWRRKVSE